MTYDAAITLLIFYQLLDFRGTIRDNLHSIRTLRFGCVPDDCGTNVSPESEQHSRLCYFRSDRACVDVN